MNRSIIDPGAVFVIAALLCGCAPQQKSPLLYPGEATVQRSEEQVRADIAVCEERASRYLGTESNAVQGKRVLLSGLEGAVVGAAAGALTGTIVEGSVGRTTGAGAAAGGLVGTYQGIKDIRGGNPKYYAFVEACLEDKGYRILGWERGS